MSADSSGFESSQAHEIMLCQRDFGYSFMAIRSILALSYFRRFTFCIFCGGLDGYSSFEVDDPPRSSQSCFVFFGGMISTSEFWQYALISGPLAISMQAFASVILARVRNVALFVFGK